MTESLANLTYVTIGGIEVTGYVISWDYGVGIEEGIDEAHILVVKTIEEYTTVNNGNEVVIKRGRTTGQESTIFRGNISLVSPKGAFLEISCQDKLSNLANKEITNVFEDQKISEIATSLVETYGGLTISADDSGEASNLNRFICNYDKIYERLTTLRKIMNWAMYYDAEQDKVIFKNKGSTSNTFVIKYDTTGTTNVGAIIRWDYDTENMVNSVTVVGGPVLDWKKDTFSGDASTKTFTLTSIPEHLEVEISGVRKTMGVLDGKSSYDYTVDKTNKTITFVTAPASASNNIVANYAIYVPVTVQRKDEDSISTYGLVEDTYYYPDILTVADAELKAQEILDRFSTPIPTTSNLPIEQPTNPIKPGDKIQVNDTINNVVRELIVTRIEYRWPDVHDIISLGMELIMDRLTVTEIEERVSKLEKREAQNIDFVNIVVSFNDYLRVKGELQIQIIDTSLDGAWGIGFSNNTDSKVLAWNAAGAVWQSTYTGSTTTESIVHQDDQYEEELLNTDYVVTEQTTATIDTSAGTVTF